MDSDLNPGSSCRLLLSVVVPVINEEEVLLEFHKTTYAVLATTGMDSETVFIDEGGQDKTITVIQSLRRDDL